MGVGDAIAIWFAAGSGTEDRGSLLLSNYGLKVVIIGSILRPRISKAMGSNARCWKELSRVEGRRVDPGVGTN